MYLTPDRPSLVRVLAHPNGELIHGDAIEWLAALPAGTVDLVIADGPYGISKAPWDRFRTPEAFVAWSLEWIREAHRVLSPTGTLYVAGFTERIAPLVAPALELFDSCHPVVWSYENKPSFRDDWGRSHELFLHLRKSRTFTFNTDAVRVPYRAHTNRYPERLSGASSLYGNKPTRWTPHPFGARPRDVIAVPVLSNGMAERTTHPTQKPEALIRRLVLASSNAGDIVVDPFVGSGTSSVVAQMEARRWAGCDQDREYLEIARRRIEQLDDNAPASLAA